MAFRHEDWIRGEIFIAILTDATAKATMLLLVSCVIAGIVRRSSAALRHWIWSLTLCGLICAPVDILDCPGLASAGVLRSRAIHLGTPAGTSHLDRLRARPNSKSGIATLDRTTLCPERVFVSGKRHVETGSHPAAVAAIPGEAFRRDDPRG